MAVTSIERNRRPSAALALFLAALMSFPVPAYSENRDSDEANQNTATPIKHVIVIIGENRTFDNIFATYVPKHGTVSNLLSRGIIHWTARLVRTPILHNNSSFRPSTPPPTLLTHAS